VPSATPENSVAPAVSGNGATTATTEPVNACPNYRGGGPCTTTPHVRWQCSDPEVAALKKTWSVWEIYCMNGTTEVRIDGDWPPPATTTGEGAR